MSEKPYSEFLAERFDAATRSQSPVVFTNRGMEHASLVINRLIGGTRKSLAIVSGCLHADVYSVDELRSCARRLGKGGIRIVLCDTIPFSDPTALSQLKPEVDSEAISVRHSPIARNHFVISDEVNIRAENDHEQKTAVVILNAEKALAKSYIDIFDIIFQRAQILSNLHEFQPA